MATILSQSKAFNGTYFKYEHDSKVLGCPMKFSVYLPNQKNPPLLIFLSGLTCNEDNFITKACALESASRLGIALVCPDTSPRIEIEGDRDNWDFGQGAGFYVDATVEKWKNYQMFSYVNNELFALVLELGIDNSRASIFGHSMGGHGALVSALRTKKYKSCSAFAPICNPTNCPWGIKAFTGYLGDVKKGIDYDATELSGIYDGPKLPVLIHQGSEDSFLKNGQLLPDNLTSVKNEKIEIEYHLEQGYDHSYWFIQTFIKDHMEFHARHLLK